ncbi:hypothetical protein C9J03_13955 [Photobacterium gaetbulicola]|nr:hypothetical protein C9J03_13955 [Photobacterium gaetbulicola]
MHHIILHIWNNHKRKRFLLCLAMLYRDILIKNRLCFLLQESAFLKKILCHPDITDNRIWLKALLRSQLQICAKYSCKNIFITKTKN